MEISFLITKSVRSHALHTKKSMSEKVDFGPFFGLFHNHGGKNKRFRTFRDLSKGITPKCISENFQTWLWLSQHLYGHILVKKIWTKTVENSIFFVFSLIKQNDIKCIKMTIFFEKRTRYSSAPYLHECLSIPESFCDIFGRFSSEIHGCHVGFGQNFGQITLTVENQLWAQNSIKCSKNDLFFDFFEKKGPIQIFSVLARMSKYSQKLLWHLWTLLKLNTWMSCEIWATFRPNHPYCRKSALSQKWCKM